MSKHPKNRLDRIGKAIYPLRVLGSILIAISILLSYSKLGVSMDIWGVVGISICIIYPHIAFLRYLKGERRETEILHMQIDMALLGVLMSLVNFTLVIALPYLIANSAGNYALRGMKQVIQGFVLTFTTGMAMVVFREQNIVIHADSIELIPPFLYLTVATHFMGYLTYVRGISLIRRKQEAEETAKLDFLTGLQNRRSMFEQIKLNDTNHKNKGHDTSLIMVDIDYFKLVNDQYGHEQGDAVLIKVSELIKKSLRNTDIVARWGGEEFLVLLPKTSAQQGTAIAEIIRSTIAGHSIDHDGVQHKVTLTLGVATYNTSSDFQKTIQLADEALYKGKKLGRNQVVTVGQPSASKRTHTKVSSTKMALA